MCRQMILFGCGATPLLPYVPLRKDLLHPSKLASSPKAIAIPSRLVTSRDIAGPNSDANTDTDIHQRIAQHRASLHMYEESKCKGKHSEKSVASAKNPAIEGRKPKKVMVKEPKEKKVAAAGVSEEEETALQHIEDAQAPPQKQQQHKERLPKKEEGEGEHKNQQRPVPQRVEDGQREQRAETQPISQPIPHLMPHRQRQRRAASRPPIFPYPAAPNPCPCSNVVSSESTWLRCGDCSMCNFRSAPLHWSSEQGYTGLSDPRQHTTKQGRYDSNQMSGSWRYTGRMGGGGFGRWETASESSSGFERAGLGLEKNRNDTQWVIKGGDVVFVNRATGADPRDESTDEETLLDEELKELDLSRYPEHVLRRPSDEARRRNEWLAKWNPRQLNMAEGKMMERVFRRSDMLGLLGREIKQKLLEERAENLQLLRVRYDVKVFDGGVRVW